MKKRTQLLYWLPVIGWMLVIFFFSSRHSIEVSSTHTVNFAFFKTLHLLEYAFLFLLTHRALRYGSDTKKIDMLTFIIIILYAMSDELHQRFVPTRESAFRDVIIDCIGAGSLWIFLTFIEPKLPKQLKNLVNNWQLY